MKTNIVKTEMVTVVRQMPADSWASDLRIMSNDAARPDTDSGKRATRVTADRIEYRDGGYAQFLKVENGVVHYERKDTVVTCRCNYCKRTFKVDAMFASASCRRASCVLKAMRDSI